MITLAHISDPHLAPLPQPRWTELIGKRITGYLNWQHKRRFMQDPETLARIVAAMKEHQPDHIAVSGDIANLALPEEFTRGRDWLQSLGEPRDVSFVPGNHDIYVGEAGAFAARQWAAYMNDDAEIDGFPYVRRRGPIALIGLSSGVPTAPFLATGWLGSKQLAALALLLKSLKSEKLFRVVMIHHPPLTTAARHKRLLDAPVLMKVLATHGAELLIHGHDHANMLNWLTGPEGTLVPAVGVASASARPGSGHTDASYNLYRIGGEAGHWQCELETRGFDEAGSIATLGKTTLIGKPSG